MSATKHGVIGLVVGVEDGRLTVVRTSPNLPAARAGITPGDRLVRIDQRATAGLTRKEAGRLIRGPVGETVTLWLERPGVAGSLAIELTREISPGSEPLPPGTKRFLLGLMAMLVAVAVGVVLVVARGRDVRDAASTYVEHLREGDTRRAYALLASASRSDVPYDTWLETMNTPLLRRATNLRVGSVKKTSAGRGCVRASVDVDGTRVHLTIYTYEESDGPKIHSVVTNAEENLDLWARARPWEC